MNKTYRVKFNQHTGTYVAVAEISVAHGKSSGSGRLVAAALLASGLGMAVFSPEASATVWGELGTSASGVTEGVAFGPYDCKNKATSQTVKDNTNLPFTKTYPAGSNHEGAWLQGERGVVIGGGCDNIAVAMEDAVAIGNGAGATQKAVALGNMALANGFASVAIGDEAQAMGVTAISIGYKAGLSQQGDSNVAIGQNTGQYVNGNENTALGQYAGGSVIGNKNTAVGVNAGGLAQGDRNAYMGYLSGSGNRGNDNLNLGTQAGQGAWGNVSVALGLTAGYGAQGDANVGIGQKAGSSINGSRNTSMGNGAGFGITGSDNIALGSNTNQGLPTFLNNTGFTARGDNNIGIGSNAGNYYYMDADGTHMRDRKGNVYTQEINPTTSELALKDQNGVYYDLNTLWTQHPELRLAVRNNSVSLGNQAYANSLSVAVGYGAEALGIDTVSIGRAAGSNAIGNNNASMGVGAGIDSRGSNNVSLGNLAGNAAKGNFNLMLGDAAGTQLTGSHNILMGQGAGIAARTDKSVLIGVEAGRYSMGTSMTIIGTNAGLGSRGEGSSIIGAEAGAYSSGTDNVLAGRRTGGYLSGNNNTAIGVEAGVVAHGNDNVFQGSGAGALTNGNDNAFTGRFSGVATTGNNNVALGYMAGGLMRVDRTTGTMYDRSGSQITAPIGVTVNNATALGNLSLVLEDDGVALGSGSVANTAAGITGTFAPIGAASPEWVSTLAAVSVGGENSAGQTMTRQITNVSAGFADTDAVNVAQLQAGLRIAGAHYFSVDDQGTTVGNYNNDGAIGDHAIAIGPDAQAVGMRVLSIGNNAGNNAINAHTTMFLGESSGYNSENAINSVFLGGQSGAYSANVTDSQFFGYSAGIDASNVSGSNFMGFNVGQGAQDVVFSNYLGNAGRDSNGVTLSTIIGYDAGNEAKSVLQSQMLGSSSGERTENITFSNMLGYGSGGDSKNVHFSDYIGFIAGNRSEGSYNTAIGYTSSLALSGDGNVSIGKMSNSLTELNPYLGWFDRAGNPIAQPLSHKVSNSVALGALSLSTQNDGVALGSNSIASTDAGITGTFAPTANPSTTDDLSNPDSHIWKGTLAAVSVGGEDPYANTGVVNSRQITNVAAGTTYTDAVNVAQLQAGLATVETHYYSVNDGGVIGSNYDNDGAKGKNSLAAGVNAYAYADNTLAVGNQAQVSSTNTTLGSVQDQFLNNSSAIGSGANVRVESIDGPSNQHNSAQAAYATAVGSDAQVRYSPMSRPNNHKIKIELG